jgi:3-methyladenine DNA glycosylase AlkD
MTVMPLDVENVCRIATQELVKRADPEKAFGMQAYMKTDMPFYGVQKAGRTQILRKLVALGAPTDRVHYQALVLGLWGLPHREEKYLAIGYARRFKSFIAVESLPLYERLILEGQWWDFVDEIAIKLVGPLVVNEPSEAWQVVDPWIDHENIWMRRSAIICQVGAQRVTDSDRLFGFCLQRAHEKEFFVRKAIGWALREYAKTNPEAVAEFVTTNRAVWSGLSFREATKHISHLLP